MFGLFFNPDVWAIFLRAGGIVLLAGLSSCSGLSTVRAVHDHPHRIWLTSTVYLRGKVGDRVPLLDAQVYELEDATGKIWVLTVKKTPQTGDTVYIKGQVRYEKTELEGLALGEAYIQEQEQLDPTEKK